MKTALAALTPLPAPHRAFAADFFSLGLPRGFAAESAFAAPAAVPAPPHKTPGARASRESAAVAGQVSVRTQDCPAGACSPLQGFGPARPVKFELALPAADFLPFPVFMRAGNYQPEKRLGITPHRQPF